MVLRRQLVSQRECINNTFHCEQYTLNMDIAFGNGNSILNLLRGVSHSQIKFGVVMENAFQTRSKLCLFSIRMELPFPFILKFSECTAFPLWYYKSDTDACT